MKIKYFVLVLALAVGVGVQNAASANPLSDILKTFEQFSTNVQKKPATKSILVPASGNVQTTTVNEDMIDFGPYMSRMYHKIKDNWNPPKLSESKKVVVYLEVENNGSLRGLKIKNTSGNKSFDDSVISAVKKSVPFEKAPKGYNGDGIKVEYEFNYNFVKKVAK